MTANTEDIIGFSLFGFIIVSLLIDAICALTWNKTYFTSGLVMFVRRIPMSRRHTNIPDLSLFENKFYSNVTYSLTFKEIDSLSYGFREKAGQFRWARYSPLMHGLLTFDTDNGQVIVKGFANWTALAFSLMWLAMPVLFLILNFSIEIITFYVLLILGAIVFFFLVMGIIYRIQAARFSNVASFAAQSWARRYVRHSEQA